MKRTDWLTGLRTVFGPGSRGRGQRCKRQHPFVRRATFELLEDRRLLSTVNTPLDNQIPDDGLITLREAIITGGDIEFDPVVFATPQTILLTFGELDVTQSVTINGPGRELLTIDGHLQPRIFDVNIPFVPYSYTPPFFTITSLTLTGGGIRKSNDLPSNTKITLIDAAITGGGIDSPRSANVSLINSTITGNTGDGIRLYGGTISLTSSTISGNGAGITFEEGGTVELQDSNIIDNAGDGIRMQFGTVSLNASEVSGNGNRGIHFNEYYGGSVVLSDATVSDNDRGGIFFRGGGDVELHSSTVSGNGHGTGQTYGGIRSFDVTLIDSTVSGNRTNSPDPYGGGISAGNVTLVNSTVSGNTTTGNGGGINTLALTLRHSTVTENHAASGGGVWFSGSVLSGSSIVSSIIAGNTATGVNPDLRPSVGVFTLATSVIGDNAGTSLVESQTPDANGNLIGSSAGGGVIDPLLGPLADNGGPTLTHALLLGSPAIDAVTTITPPTVADTAIHVYELNGSLADERGGPSVVSLGGTLTASGYEFGPNQGLNLTSASFAPAEYSVEIVFSWDELSGLWQKIIDFHDRALDVGLYTLGNGLQFFDQVFTGGLFSANTLHHLVLTRNDATDMVRAYVDGAEAWSFLDSGSEAVFTGATQIIRFFQDDFVTGQAQAESGFVDRIRIFDYPLDAAEVAELFDPPPPPPPPPLYDQRGAPFARLYDGDSADGARIDMGAFELQPLPAPNEDPVFTSSDTVDVAENTTAVMTVTATDEDLPPQTVTFSIVGGADEAKFGITSSGVLSFNSAPDYEAPSDANADNVYEVTVEADDGAGGTATQAINVLVTPVNEYNPVFSSSDTLDVAENTTVVMTVTATDADLPAQSVTFSIVGGADAARFGMSAGGALSFNLPPNFEAPTDANANNVYEVTVRASDNNGRTATQAIVVTVTPLNEFSPVFTSPDTADMAENTTDVMTVTATDADLPAQGMTFSIVGGADAANFSITESGELSFNSSPDFEAPVDADGDNVYEVIVATMANCTTEECAGPIQEFVYWSDTGTQKIQRSNLDGSNVEDIVTLDSGFANSVAIHPLEHKIYWTSLAGMSIQRANLDGSNIETVLNSAYSGASSWIALDTVNNKMYWTDSLDDNIRRANLDGSNLEVIVSGAHHPNGIYIDVYGGKLYWTESTGGDRIRRANLDGTSVELLIGTGLDQPGGIVIDAAASVMYFTDQTGETIERANLDGSDRVTLIESAELDFPAGLVIDTYAGKMYWSEASFTSGKIRRANLDGSNIEDIYVGVNPVGIALSPISCTATQTINVTVTPVNDNSPLITSPVAASVPENTTTVMTVTATDADVPPQDITFSIVGGADAAMFGITTDGVLTFNSPPDFEAPTDANGNNVYVVTVRASDGSLTTNSTVLVAVTPVNDNDPVFTSPDMVEVVEGGTAVLTVMATDADLPPQAVAFSIAGGADQAHFGITSAGVLSFNSAPVFEAPTDADSDNEYVVTVRADDGNGRTTEQTISVRVFSITDFGDAPDGAAGTGAGNYQTVVSDNGPQHTIVGGLRMGANVDGDGGALQNVAAIADDVDGALPIDEDGLVNPATDLVLTVGAQPVVNVWVTNTTGAAATLYGWIDYNADGVFDNATERASIAVPDGTNGGIATLVFPAIPLLGFTGTTYARFRLSTDAAAADPTGAALDGEVEDYRVAITKRSEGAVDGAKTMQIASAINGGPVLANGSLFGSSVASLGDLDGDGVTDLAVGAQLTPGGGAVAVLLMNLDGTVKSSQKIAGGIGGGPTLFSGDRFGRGLASLGDLDGDGVTDLAVGTDQDDTGGSNRGAVHVLFLNADGTVKASQEIASGTGGGPTLANVDRFGTSTASVGDLDGDGVTDLAVGADGDDTGGNERGAVHLLFLNADGTVKATQKIASGTGGGPTLADGDRFGRSVISLGDLDGDGVTDLAVGAVADDTGGSNRGAVYVLLLNASGTVKSSQKIASGTGGGPVLADGDSFGNSAAFLGDLDGDGVHDMAVGAFYDNAGGPDRGAAYVLLLNANGTVKASQKIASGIGGGPTLADNSSFGSAVSSLGDLDGDGLVDLAVGSERNDTGGTDRGALYVLFLKELNFDPVITSPDAANVAENTTAVMTVTATDADLPAQTVTFSIVGGADAARFGITSGGALSFNAAPDYEAPTDLGGDNVYEVTVEASDGVGGTAMQTVNVTVTPVNDNAPVFTSPDTVNVAENTTAVLTVTATDADLPAQAVTFSIVGGADAAKFGITSGGVLSFNSTPNFEAPTDSNGDNVYVVIVQASDGALTSLQAVLVTVTNVDEVVLGDYNQNGKVDAADYTSWRDRLGQTFTLPGENPAAATPGLVDSEDYNFWKANFGATEAGAGSGSAAVVAGPLAEPVTREPGPPPPAESTVEAAPISPEPQKDVVEQSISTLRFVIDVDRRSNHARPSVRPLPLAAIASHDDALLSWLASRARRSRREATAAPCHHEWSGESSHTSDPDQLADALKLAFASLGA